MIFWNQHERRWDQQGYELEDIDRTISLKNF